MWSCWLGLSTTWTVGTTINFKLWPAGLKVMAQRLTPKPLTVTAISSLSGLRLCCSPRCHPRGPSPGGDLNMLEFFVCKFATQLTWLIPGNSYYDTHIHIYIYRMTAPDSPGSPGWTVLKASRNHWALSQLHCGITQHDAGALARHSAGVFAASYGVFGHLSKLFETVTVGYHGPWPVFNNIW